MSSNALLLVSNVQRIRQSLCEIQKYVKNLYIQLNIPPEKVNPVPSWNKVITQIYCEGHNRVPLINVTVCITPLKSKPIALPKTKIDMLFSDSKFPEVCDSIRDNLNIPSETIYLTDDRNAEIVDRQSLDGQHKVYDTVVLGGTFDRIHVGHKILLTAAILRCTKKLVVGVTDENMIKSKKLPELILPVEQRIEELKCLLMEIDSTLQYDVVPISDPFGPTQSDPDMDMIVVSAETLRGGHKVNEIRAANNLKPLEIFAIDLIEGDAEGNDDKELKVSSGNIRMDLLGTRINKIQPKPHLPDEPYVIFLTGGIATGKSIMAKRLESMGAFVLDYDKIAHELYEPGKVCYKQIVEYFGEQILDAEGRIDRRKLGPIVFANPEKLEKLNAIVWPELLVEGKRRIREAYEEKGFKVVVAEAAVVLKAGWESECHEIWSMIISPKEAVRRVVERNGLSEDAARQRIGSQLDNSTVVRKSNVVFSSEWSSEYTHQQAVKAWKMLVRELEERKNTQKSCL